MSTETQRPTSELSDVGLVANNHLDHNHDPDSDSTTVNATDNNVNTEWGANFDAPTGPLTIGAGLQEFRAGVEEFDSGQSGTPQARIELWESGALVRTGNYVDVRVFTVLSFTWDADELLIGGGAPIQMKVRGSKTGGKPSKRNTIRTGGLEWNVNYTIIDSPTVIAPSIAAHYYSIRRTA